MNNFSDVREMLMHNKRLHLKTAQFYRGLADQSRDTRTTMLLNTLCKHEVQLAEELKRYLDEAPEKVLNTYIQYDRRKNSDDLFDIHFDAANCVESDVEKLASKVNDYFCELYKELARAADVRPVSEMFDNLYEHIVEEKKSLSKDLISLSDI